MLYKLLYGSLHMMDTLCSQTVIQELLSVIGELLTWAYIFQILFDEA